MIPFKTLEAYFNDIRVRAKRTDVGISKVSPLVGINFALEQLLESGKINPSKLFFDAGFGDGRILLLTAGMHGIPSAGAEYDKELAEIAEYNIRKIGQLDIAIGKMPQMPQIILARGNFREDETYSGAGIKFGDIATFYNYSSNPYQIVEKIVRQSPRGTRFLYYGRNDPIHFEGLTLEQNVEFARTSRPRLNVLHVYRK